MIVDPAGAVCALHDVALEATELAELALAIELEELGIAAGLQDRVAQAFGGLMFMEFDPAAGPDRYRRLDSGAAAAARGRVARGRRRRLGRGPRAAARPATTRRARGRRPRWLRWLSSRGVPATRCSPATTPSSRAASIAASTPRQRILSLDRRHVEMIDAPAACGASANYAGSGGAIVAVCAPDGREPVARELQELGCDTLLI